MSATLIESNAVGVVFEPLEVVTAELAAAPVVAPTKPAAALELVEEMLKRPAVVDARLRQQAQLPRLVPQMLAIALAGYTVFCLAAALTLTLAPVWPPGVPRGDSLLRTWLALLAAYDIGILAAIGICLPSFYFYALLAGVRITMLETVAHALKGHAVAAVVLVGLVPVYLAITLGLQVFHAPEMWFQAFDYLLLTLPFQTGVAGAWSLYRGFIPLCDTMAEHFAQRRHCFLRRLLLSWTACSTVITPLVIYTIWLALAGSAT